jgi:hypothetical protein
MSGEDFDRRLGRVPQIVYAAVFVILIVSGFVALWQLGVLLLILGVGFFVWWRGRTARRA